ncbi:MAG: DUF374 domain-containing protein [Candidatus Hydrogenedentes bacterium]|nr:DUF374 domain-containing protein [Candidatus Hydrogenedentota bacterium]
MEQRNVVYWNEANASGQCVLLAFWHEVLGVAAFTYRDTGFHTLTSYSFDGELAARIVNHFGLHALRGSSSRGGLRALVELQKAIKHVPAIGLTLDGPKGPPREAKPGVGILAARTKAPIIPVAFAATPCWRMRSWDRLIVPKPFGRIICAYGPPIFPDPDDDSPAAIELLRSQTESTLCTLHEELDREFSPRPVN